MYKELFDRNKEALEFIKKKVNIDDNQLYSLWPISRTDLNCKTIVGIAELMTEFANIQNKKINETI